MKLKDYLFKVAPRAVSYELARRGLISPPRPLLLTYSVTAACRSLCRTCNIGRTYLKNPELAKQDLSLAEIEQIFKSLGSVYFFNISGGEPFMRMDLAEIVRLAAIYLKPSIIHIPTNALAPRAIEKTTGRILDYMDQFLPASVPLSIKPSIDGIGDMHDYVRGVQGNFAKLEETIDRLLAVRSRNPRLHVDLGTVISNFNLHHLDVIENWVHARGIESYRHEIAEQRVEFHNIGDPITPSPAVYEQLTRQFADKIVRNIKNKAFVTRALEAVRVAYYQVAIQILKQRRQVTSCYGGLSNIHLNYNGDIWPCCILGAEKNLGNVRDWNYDVPRLLSSDQAQRSKKYISDKHCACPLANQWLINVLLTPRHMLKALYTYLVRFPLTKKPQAERRLSVDPKAVRVHISGTSARQAIVLKKAGTIPTPENAELPVFINDSAVKTSMRLVNVASPAERLPVHRVQCVRELTATTYVLRIDRNDVDFTPGQYFIINRKGSFQAREYTVYSSTDDNYLEFIITEVNGGKVSPALRNCAPGDLLELEGPMGYFRLDTQNQNGTRHYFIATGSGIAPFHSFVGSFERLNYRLLHGVRYAADRYDIETYAPERYIQCVSREKDGNFPGRVTDYLRQNPVEPDGLFYLCGNCDMLFEAYDILVDKGVDRQRIMTEVFY
jgi:ferredoxin-NADP reductase/MoaA/NifB/PqqE/SkfB family radical SAM enzyme